jgi:hypothetical protein
MPWDRRYPCTAETRELDGAYRAFHCAVDRKWWYVALPGVYIARMARRSAAWCRGVSVIARWRRVDPGVGADRRVAPSRAASNARVCVVDQSAVAAEPGWAASPSPTSARAETAATEPRTVRVLLRVTCALLPTCRPVRTAPARDNDLVVVGSRAAEPRVVRNAGSRRVVHPA